MESTETEPKVTPHSLITEQNVKSALEADKGSDAQLVSWKIVDFTQRGDNYACVVTSVQVRYRKKAVENAVSYVVKLNACRSVKGVVDFTPFMFSKEGRFYQELVPVLNDELTAAGQKPLRVAKCFFVSLEKGKEQMYLEDLRARGFKMFDRKKGMDKDHATLVLAELARLHAASHLLQNRLNEGETLSTKYEFVSNEYMAREDILPLIDTMMKTNVDTGIMMLKEIGGYESTIEWLKSFRVDAGEIFMLDQWNKKFSAVIHGDCWNNNILFRYDADGRPVETMLVDIQGCRETSLATDLNYFLYASLIGDVRRPNVDDFISFYYSSYQKVVEGGKLPMCFTHDELLQEFRSMNKFGLLIAMTIIPALLMEPEETPEMSGTDLAKLMEDFRKIALSKLKTNPLCKSRFLSVFDEFREIGLIS